MQPKFIELLNQYGVTAEQTTKKIAELKAEFDDLYETYQDAVDNLKNMDEDDDDSVEREEIATMISGLNDLDADIIKKLESWDKNKEVWAKGRAVLAEKRAAKKNGGQDVPAPVETQAPQSPVQPQPQPIPVEGIPANSGFEGDGGVVKKKSNAGWWILAGIVGIVTLGAVVMKKE